MNLTDRSLIQLRCDISDDPQRRTRDDPGHGARIRAAAARAACLGVGDKRHLSPWRPEDLRQHRRESAMRLDGKTALITGGVSGIGKATAFEFARQGALVIVADINAEGGAATVADAEAAGLPIAYLPLDLADSESVDACAAAALDRHGRVDILVNAAGWDRSQPFVENSADFIDRVLAINLRGPMGLTQKLIPAMAANGYGKIVNVASDAGRVGSLGETVYAGAKGGMIAFTKSLARETARFHITVNCVCPGPTDTPLFAVQPEKVRLALEKAIPFRRIAQPREIADAILFFASPRSDYVTAQVLSVSSGLTMVG